MIPGSRQRETVVNLKPKFITPNKKSNVKKETEIKKTEPVKVDNKSVVKEVDNKPVVKKEDIVVETIDNLEVETSLKVDDISITDSSLEVTLPKPSTKKSSSIDEEPKGDFDESTTSNMEEGSNFDTLSDENYIYDLKGQDDVVSESTTKVSKKRKRKKSK